MPMILFLMFLPIAGVLALVFVSIMRRTKSATAAAVLTAGLYLGLVATVGVLAT